MRRLMLVLTLIFSVLFAVSVIIGCQNRDLIKWQNLTDEQVNYYYFSKLAIPEELPDGSLKLTLPDGYQFVGFDEFEKEVKSQSVVIQCICESGDGICHPFYDNSTGLGGCATANCTICKSIRQNEPTVTITNLAILYQPEDLGSKLALISFIDKDYEPIDEFAEIKKLDCPDYDITLTEKDIEYLKTVFVEPEDYNKPFFLYPLKYKDNYVVYVATTEMTLPGYYIPVSSLNEAKCLGCNGNCELKKKLTIIYCEATCGECTLKVKK